VSLGELNDINHEWADSMRADSYESFFTHQPFGESCWAQKTKAVLCNLESYDDSFDNEKILDLEHISTWLTHNKGTTRMSALYLIGLKRTLAGQPVTESDLRAWRLGQ